MNRDNDKKIFMILLILFLVIGSIFSFPLFSLFFGTIPVLVGVAAIILILTLVGKNSSNPRVRYQSDQFSDHFKRELKEAGKHAGKATVSLGKEVSRKLREEIAKNQELKKSQKYGQSRTKQDFSDYGSHDQKLNKEPKTPDWSSFQTERSRSRPQIPHPFYTSSIQELENDIQVISSRKDKVYQLLDDLFGNSKITITRYRQVIDSSEKTLQMNLNEAKKAINLFDEYAVPTPEHQAIIQKFVDNSEDIVESFEKVVLELLELQQNRTFSASDHLDENLDELARTTRYYRDGSAH